MHGLAVGTACHACGVDANDFAPYLRRVACEQRNIPSATRRHWQKQSVGALLCGSFTLMSALPEKREPIGFGHKPQMYVGSGFIAVRGTPFAHGHSVAL